MAPVPSICCHRNRIRFRDKLFFFLLLLFGLFFAFLPSSFIEGATAAPLKSEASVDANRKDVGDRVASLKARL